jgi:hypothetical protein
MMFGPLNDVPPKLNIQCLTLQKDTEQYCKASIISNKIYYGIFAPCFVGNWSVAKGAPIELHKF